MSATSRPKRSLTRPAAAGDLPMPCTTGRRRTSCQPWLTVSNVRPRTWESDSSLEQFQLHSDLIARGEVCLAADLLLYGKQVAAAVEREDRRPPTHVIDPRFDLDRPEPARAAESVGTDLVRLLLWHRDEVPAARGIRSFPDPQ